MPVTAVTSVIVSSILSAIANAPSGAPVAIDTATAIQADTQGGLRGIMYPPANGLVQIGNVVFQLSPGAQIRNQSNLIVQPAYVQQASLVRFQLDQQGAVVRVWMLPTPQ